MSSSPPLPRPRRPTIPAIDDEGSTAGGAADVLGPTRRPAGLVAGEAADHRSEDHEPRRWVPPTPHDHHHRPRKRILPLVFAATLATARPTGSRAMVAERYGELGPDRPRGRSGGT